MFYPLTDQSWGPEEYCAMQRVIQSGQWTYGAEVKAFEDEFSAYHGRNYGVMVNSGSSANLIAVGALIHSGIWGKDEQIAVPALAWSTTYSPLAQYGLRLRIFDINPDTLNVDSYPSGMSALKVSILGNPAGNYHCNLEDNCESLDAELNGKKTGKSGDLSTFSFFHSHQISTGEGGMVLTDSKSLYQLLLMLRAHGWDRDIRGISPLYTFHVPGFNVRPLEISAAIGREQLKKLPEMTRLRRQNLKIYQELFGGSERWRIQAETGKSSAFAFTFVTPFDRTRIFSALQAADIGHRATTGGCFTEHPAAKYYDYEAGPLPNAMMVHKQGFFVGNQPRDLEEQLVKLKEVMEKVCQ